MVAGAKVAPGSSHVDDVTSDRRGGLEHQRAASHVEQRIVVAGTDCIVWSVAFKVRVLRRYRGDVECIGSGIVRGVCRHYVPLPEVLLKRVGAIEHLAHA